MQCTNNFESSSTTSSESIEKLPFFSQKIYYKNALCFVRCKPTSCIPKEISGMFELRSSQSITILPNSTSEIALDILILLPVKTYASITLSLKLVIEGLFLLNPIHYESNTGTVTLIVKNHSNSNIFIDKLCIVASMIVSPRVATPKYFCIESYELTRSPHELNKFFDVCKAKEENLLFKI